MIDFGLIVFRFLHYGATTTLAGVAFFAIYAYAGSEPAALARWRNGALIWSSLSALVSGLGWFTFAVANMSGGLADVADPEVLASVVFDTGFGVVWTMRMLLAALLIAVTIAISRVQTSKAQASKGGDLLISLLAAGLLASLAGVGHSQVEEGWQGGLHVAADAAHLLAAGAWLGGLVPLGFVLLRHAGQSNGPEAVDVDDMLMRFSGMGYAAVATLVGTGIVNSWLLVGSVSSLIHSTYGLILIAKLVFFVGMLMLAAANRFWLVPALKASERTGTGVSGFWRRRLRIHVLSEQGLGLLILLCVSVVGTIRPAIGQ
jgi:putative copper resistance protein D